MAEYLYGIIDESASAPSGTGVQDQPLRVVTGSGAGALVSDLPEDGLKLGRKDLLAHGRVLEDALASGPVLPVRFGTVMNDDRDVLERLLTPHADELRRQLTEFSGKVEMRVRATYEEEPLLRAAVKSDPEIERLRGAGDYHSQIALGERIAGAVEGRRQLDSEELMAALEPLAVAVEMGEPTHERIAFNASFLLERERVGEFDSALEALARDRAELMRFKSVGPMPPHSFVELGEAV